MTESVNSMDQPNLFQNTRGRRSYVNTLVSSGSNITSNYQRPKILTGNNLDSVDQSQESNEKRFIQRRGSFEEPDQSAFANVLDDEIQ